MVTDIFQPDLIRKTTEICFDFFSVHSGQLSLLLEVAKERPDLMESYVSKIGSYICPPPWTPTGKERSRKS